MWWSRAFLLVGLLALGPVGCGFAPMYAKGDGQAGAAGGNAAEMADVGIAPISDHLGQQLRNALVQRITPRGEPGTPRYHLTVHLTEIASDLGYRRDSFATLGSLTLMGTVLLTNDNRQALLGNTVQVTVYFDYLGPRYASVATERDAEDRAITQMAEDIRSQVGAAIARFKINPTDPRYRRREEDLSPMESARP